MGASPSEPNRVPELPFKIIQHIISMKCIYGCPDKVEQVGKYEEKKQGDDEIVYFLYGKLKNTGILFEE